MSEETFDEAAFLDGVEVNEEVQPLELLEPGRS